MNVDGSSPSIPTMESWGSGLIQYSPKNKLIKNTSVNLNDKTTEITTINYDGDKSKEIIVSDNNNKFISKNIFK